MGATRNAAKKSPSYPARNEQANVHVDSSQEGSDEFVLCAIDTYPVCFQISKKEVIEEEAPKEAEEAELGLINLSVPDTVQLLEAWKDKGIVTSHHPHWRKTAYLLSPSGCRPQGEWTRPCQCHCKTS